MGSFVLSNNFDSFEEKQIPVRSRKSIEQIANFREKKRNFC